MSEEYQELYEMIINVERRVGLVGEDRNGTVSGEIDSLIENSFVPVSEIDLPITGDNFSLKKAPVNLGDTSVVNGHVIISIASENGVTMIEEWRGIEFSGRIGTLSGANGKYNGEKVTVTYFSSMRKLFSPSIVNGYIESIEIFEDEDDIIMKDVVTGVKSKIIASSDGSLSIKKVDSSMYTNDLITDTVTGEAYSVFMNDGFINYEKVV